MTPETLRAAGLAKRRHPVKILARARLTKKLTVRAHAFSAAAKEKIEKAGGTIEADGPSGASDEVAVQASEPAGTARPNPPNRAEGEDVDGGVR